MIQLLKRLYKFSDVIILVLLFLLGWRVSTHFIEKESLKPQFYQQEFSPAVLKACGKGFNVPLSDIPKLNDFLTLKTDSFSCNDLPETLKTGSPNLFQKGHRYLMDAAALVWSASTISWNALLPLYGIFFGATISLSYALFRIGMGRILSLTGALLLTFSSLHLDNLPNLRDYSKAPFILALVLIMGCMVKWPLKRRTILGLSGLFGAVLGVALGFRMDTIIFIPAFFLVVFLFLPGGINKNLLTKVFALCLCLVIFLIVGWPIITGAFGSGSNTFHVILLGLMSPFDTALGVKGSIYELGYRYNDLYLYSILNSYSYRIHHDINPVYLATHEYENIGMQYYFEILKHFPADILIRSYASFLKILKLPFDINPHLFSWAGLVKLNSNGFVLFLSGIALAVFRVHSLRVSIYLLFIIIFLACYPMLQFHPRHYFHLEFISLWMFGFVLHQTCHSAIGLRNSETRKKWKEIAFQPKVYLIHIRRISLFIVSVFLIFYGLLYSMRLYQQSHLKNYFQSYLASDIEKIEFARSPLNEEKTLITDFRIKGKELHGYEQGNFPVKTNYFVAEFDGNKCKSDFLFLKPRYTSDSDYTDQSRTVGLDISSPIRYFFPVYSSSSYIPATMFYIGKPDSKRRFSIFNGIEIASKDLACLTSLSQIKDLQNFPLLLTLKFSTKWEKKPLYQRLIYNIYQKPKTPVYYYPQYLESIQDIEDPLFRQVSMPPSSDIIWHVKTFNVLNRQLGYNFFGKWIEIKRENIWTVKGKSDSVFGYLAKMQPKKLDRGSYFIAQGKLNHGGFTLGMVDNDKWVLQLNVTRPGEFKIIIYVPSGTYVPIVANCLQDSLTLQGSLMNDFEITKIGWTEN